MGTYSETIRRAMVQRLTLPGGPSAAALARETGIGQTTLSKWKISYGSIYSMNKKKSSNQRTIEEKFQILMEVQGMSDSELGEYLRKNGLHTDEITRWKQECLEGLAAKKRGRPKKDPELAKLEKEHKTLKRDLRRKDKALAEASALLILKKKADLIWGDPEDEE